MRLWLRGRMCVHVDLLVNMQPSTIFHPVNPECLLMARGCPWSNLRNGPSSRPPNGQAERLCLTRYGHFGTSIKSFNTGQPATDRYERVSWTGSVASLLQTSHRHSYWGQPWRCSGRGGGPAGDGMPILRTEAQTQGNSETAGSM